MGTRSTTTVSAGPEYWLAPMPAAEAPLHDFGDPQLHHEAQQPDPKAFEAHDFGGDDDHG